MKIDLLFKEEFPKLCRLFVILFAVVAAAFANYCCCCSYLIVYCYHSRGDAWSNG